MNWMGKHRGWCEVCTRKQVRYVHIVDEEYAFWGHVCLVCGAANPSVSAARGIQKGAPFVMSVDMLKWAQARAGELKFLRVLYWTDSPA